MITTTNLSAKAGQPHFKNARDHVRSARYRSAGSILAHC